MLCQNQEIIDFIDWVLVLLLPKVESSSSFVCFSSLGAKVRKNIETAIEWPFKKAQTFTC